MSLAAAATFGVFASTLIVFVLWPLRRPAAPAEACTALTSQELVRDQRLRALRELELDRSTGVVSQEDYRKSLPELRAEAIEALAALEAVREQVGDPGFEPGTSASSHR